MRASSWYTLGLVVPALAAVLYPSLVHAAPPSSLAPTDINLLELDVLLSSIQPHILKRDDHHHGSGPVKTVLNETEILMFHAPTPPSYYTIDWEGDDVPGMEGQAGQRHPGLMILHILFMSIAFFLALPAGIALRSVNHPWHGFSVILFWVFCILGCSASALYSKLTPDMYEHQKHSIQGYFFLFIALCVSAVDIIHLISRLVAYVRSIRSGSDNFSIAKLWKFVVLAREEEPAFLGSEYEGLVDETEQYDLHDLQKQENVHNVDLDEQAQELEYPGHEHRPGHKHTFSASSERTVFGMALESPSGSNHSSDTLTHSPNNDKHGYFHFHHDSLNSSLHEAEAMTKKPLVKQIGRGVFATAERVLVFGGFMQVLSGIVVYTGGCRESFVNNCLAHLIKGGIFWCYGLITFARFLGSFSELGWAWNRAPHTNNKRSYPTAEFVESFVIFLYGISNTWMERFGVEAGAPYTTKQVQHIGIAVMFWFAGLVGMGLESRRLRRWLGTAALSNYSPASGDNVEVQEAVAEPPSYVASFNPFPALVIGVTGLAMSAHYQEYLFQVQIHQLWGWMLACFSLLRFLTYFFLWLGPPRSMLPSRPPTEALASFFLACGGLMFIFSTEEVTWAAMRRGRDDMMMFLNVAVAITCFCFCWTMGVVAFKGYLKSRTLDTVKFRSSA